jgi:hypothetical protein
MIKEINYNNDIITIDINQNTFKSKDGIKYDTILSPVDNSIQFLIPPNQSDISINAETGEVIKLQNEDDLEF